MTPGTPIRPVFLALLLLATQGCELGTEPGTVDDLTFTASMSRTSIPVGESATLEMRVSNHSAREVVVSFPHSCQILPYIEDATGTVAYPGGGGWGCLTVVTEMRLAPGESRLRTLEIRGGTTAPPGYEGARLPPGEYRAYAELGERPRPKARSNTVTFAVTP